MAQERGQYLTMLLLAAHYTSEMGVFHSSSSSVSEISVALSSEDQSPSRSILLDVWPTLDSTM